MSLTQRLASVSALHPWRVLAGWGLALVASIGAIAALLGVGPHHRCQHHDPPGLGARR
ncbi:MAG: hypothetical protein H0U28_06095 [Nocardioidaceae bacterium]|nr:hypothetical protein [Nocardioidaceae bacterium]